MSVQDPATENQMRFMSNLYNGAIQGGRQAFLPDALQTGTVEQLWHNGITRGQASEIIDYMIYNTEAVPADKIGKLASQKQADLYASVAAQLNDTNWQNISMVGKHMWTASKFIDRVIELQNQEKQGAGQAQQPAQPAAAAAINPNDMPFR